MHINTDAELEREREREREGRSVCEREILRESERERETDRQKEGGGSKSEYCGSFQKVRVKGEREILI